MQIKEKQMNYVSDIDQFLQAFDKKHPELSKSQKKEIEKHQRIVLLRDDANYTEPKNDEFNF